MWSTLGGRFLLLLFFTLVQPQWSWADTSQGIVTGGIRYSLPAWFKQSFLDFQDDVTEAAEQNKHLMLFLHLDECPYCARVIDENFREDSTAEYFKSRFDIVALNVRGDLQVTWVDGKSYQESELRKMMGVFATPTIVFLSTDGKQVLTLPGYRNSASLKVAADYIHNRHYATSTFAEYLSSQARAKTYLFRDHPKLEFATYLKGLDKPLAVIFEDKFCTECDRFHDTTLRHPEIMDALSPFLFVRLDAESKQVLINPIGEKTTPYDWVRSLGLTYRPSIILFDQGRELYRADGRLYHQHLLEALSYVSGGHYSKFESLSAYKRDFREKRLKQGKDVNFGEYVPGELNK